MARQVRAGLEVADIRAVKKSEQISALDKLRFGKPVRRHVKEFGMLFGFIFLAAALYMTLKGKPFGYTLAFSLLAIVTLALGYRRPEVLHPVWKGWMAFADMLGHVVNHLILFVAWFGMFIPVGIFLKLFGKKVMDLRFRADVESYWEERDTKYDDFKLMERQF